ncbi:MAG: tRNA 2-thiouridine(34) synthase MnmA, partial [Oscillospiraceae bacterium]|nr:tRNA 2-thiouridine(34) synthase MnmA [Oscillospiraceae bacterium]
MKNKVLLGLSGGVDSSLAALLLKSAGYDVVGVYLYSRLGNDESDAARAAADFCGIPLEIVDISSELEDKVCPYFVNEYCRGRTPSPCIVCNPNVKFKALFSAAERLGADFVATGHYARIDRTEKGETAVFCGVGRNDQSYMLCRMPRECFSKLIFPLGGFSKDEVRKMAEEKNIPTAKKPDSMEICFIPDGKRVESIEVR